MHDLKNPSPDSQPPRSVQAEPPEEHTGLTKGDAKKVAAGLPAVTNSLKMVYGQAGLGRGTKALLKLNQKNGFDCPSCAWPDPDDERSPTEFCENGAKAVASEATARRITAEFFTQYSVAELSEQQDYWMDQQGRLTEPMVLHEDSTHYVPISWDRAFDLIAQELNALDSPDEAVFYTSGRASNEAAFLYGLFARKFGTNNLPDCSNMCHESSGAALKASLGVGKGTVSLDDFYDCDTILLIGQNPGTNHPRMLSALQKAERNGATIIAVNPLKEAGLLAFAHPQEVVGLLGGRSPLSSEYLQVNVNGDLALLQGINKVLLEEYEERIDREFIEAHTTGFEAFRENILEADWEEIERRSGIPRKRIEHAARLVSRERKRLITCWAMGLTQHKNAVATIREVANLHLLLGAVGRPGAGVCPVRGHSNVQGDRTMGIFEAMPDAFLDAIGQEFRFEPPRRHGWNTVQAIQAMHEGRGKVFFALGGNFLQATPDTEFTAEALRKCNLTVQVSTKLNRSHLVTGKVGLILPCLGRSDQDIQSGHAQFVTVENSMGVVHQSHGNLEPPSSQLLSETAIVARLADATLGSNAVLDWLELAANYDRIRDRIERCIPGFEDFNQRVRQPGGFYLPNSAKERKWDTPEEKAVFCPSELSGTDLEEGELLLMTLRSHDQFNTTIYGLDDRYRGIHNERRLVFMNPADMRERGIGALKPVDLTSHFNGKERHVRDFLAIPYDIPARTVAGYFPELNPLVPVDSFADISETPTSKSIRVTIVPAE